MTASAVAAATAVAAIGFLLVVGQAPQATPPTVGDDGRIAVVGRDGDILTVDATTGVSQTLWRCPDACHVTALAWSPDGTRLAYAERNDIWLLDPLRGERRQLASCGDCASPYTTIAWSPDGSRIAFTQASQVFAVDMEGRVVELARAADGRWVTLPRWTTGGISVEFLVVDEGFVTIYSASVTPAASPPSREATFPVARGDPSPADWAWSPDGRRIAFTTTEFVIPRPVANGRNFARVWIMDRDGSDRARVLEVPDCCRNSLGMPSWSPDGQAVSVVLGPIVPRMYTVRIGEPARQLTVRGWRPESDRADLLPLRVSAVRPAWGRAP